MRLYRIVRERYLESYDGRGHSFIDGARWNKPGIPVIYFGTSPAVAMLELANYIPSPRHVPKDYRLGIYDLPDCVPLETLPASKLPSDWVSYPPYPPKAQEVGSEFLLSGHALGLVVPSAASPAGIDQCVVINPLQANIGKIKLIDTVEQIYNKRIFGGL